MFEPMNEQGVIIVFAQGMIKAQIELVSIQTNYPDAIICYRGKNYKTEFEYRSSNFVKHNHDVRDCDVIICWENDLGDFVLPIIELSNLDWMSDIALDIPSQAEKTIAYWKDRALKAEKQSNDVGRPVHKLQPDILAQAMVDEPSVRKGMEKFGLSQLLFIRYRDFGLELKEELERLGMSFRDK